MPTRITQDAVNQPTVCVLCSHNCGLVMDVAENKIKAIRADKNNPITRGYSCNKAYAIEHYVNHKQRLTSPLKRQPDGSFKPISWDQATIEIGERLQVIANNYAPRSIANVLSGQGNHLGAVWAATLLMTVDSGTHFNALGQEKTQHALLNQWMFKADYSNYFHSDEENADYYLVMGSNPALSNRGRNATETIKHINADDSRKLVVVDPKKTETARRANMHLPIKVGTDVYFMLAMAANIVQNNWTDRRFLNEYGKDFTPIEKVLRSLDTTALAHRCQLDPEEVKQVAHEFSQAKSASMLMDLGVEQSLFSTLTAYLYRLIPLLTGQVAKTGAADFISMFAPKGLVKPQTQKALASELESIALFAPLGSQSYNLIAEEILTDHPDRIRALFVDGANPVIQAAESKTVKRALQKLDLLVVVDPAFTETAACADYVLPASVGYEKWEYSFFPASFPEVSFQLRPPVINPPKGALPESEIYHRILKSAGLITQAPMVLHRMAKRATSPLFSGLYLGTLTSLAAIKTRSKPGSAKHTGLMLHWAYETLGPYLEAPQLVYIWLNAHLFALTRPADIVRQYPEWRSKNPFKLASQLYEKIMASPHGLFVGKVDRENHFKNTIGFKDKKVRLSPPAMLQEIQRALDSEEHADPEFPFILQGGFRSQWNANVIIRDPSWRKGKKAHEALTVSPTDAQRLGLANDDRVQLSTRVASAQIPVRIDPHVQPGHVNLPTGFGVQYPDPETGELRYDGIRINELTDRFERDPFTGCPHHKYIRCQLEKVDSNQENDSYESEEVLESAVI